MKGRSRHQAWLPAGVRGPAALPVFPGRGPGGFPYDLVEVLKIAESALDRDRLHLQAGLAEQFTGPVDPFLANILPHAAAELALKNLREMV